MDGNCNVNLGSLVLHLHVLCMRVARSPKKKKKLLHNTATVTGAGWSGAAGAESAVLSATMAKSLSALNSQ